MVRLARPHHSLDRAGAAIALTFDDGPDPVATPQILDELRRLDIAATFFLVGQRARAHPEIVQRILDEGHAIGSHSATHPEAWKTSLVRVLRDYRQGHAAVRSAAGRPVRLFRPPNGYLDGAGAVALWAARIRPWLWTIDPEDWQPGATTAEILANLAEVRAGDVVLLHDGLDGPGAQPTADRGATRAALAGIADLAGQRGLHFTTLA